jgi:hypothetical protein
VLARNKEEDNGEGAWLFVLLAVAATFPLLTGLCWLFFKNDISDNVEDYAFSDEERRQLKALSTSVRGLERELETEKGQGASRKADGSYDRRSRAGKRAFELEGSLKTQSEQCDTLAGLPQQRLAHAINAAKIHTASASAFLFFIPFFGFEFFRKGLLRQPWETWGPVYVDAAVYTVGVFAGVWLALSVIYYLVYSKMRSALEADVAS